MYFVHLCCNNIKYTIIMRLIFKFIQYSDHSFPEHMDGLV